MSEQDNVTRIDTHRQIGAGGGNGGNDLRERVARIETELKHLATKKDIERLKAWILGGVIVGMVIAATLGTAIGKLFLSSGS